MAKVKITWKAFGEKPELNKFITSVEFDTDFEVNNVDQLLNVIYHVTNTYSGNLWEIIKPKLSPNRTHTAISIGDEVEIDGTTYVCADFGWVVADKADIKYLPSEYGDGSVFSVKEKVNG